MSSDLFEFVEEDENGTSLLGTMNASGYLFLSLESDMHYYVLSSDNNGKEQAKAIIAGLEEWIRHIEEDLGK